MISDKEFLESELQMGIGFHNEGFKNLAFATVDAVKPYPFKTVMDYGAGTGVYAYAFDKMGYDVSVWEKFDVHKEYIKENAPGLKIIDKPITTDLMVFIEVSEHMTDKELNALFKKIKPNYILFSSTSNRTDRDADWGHINVKEQSEWIAYFEKIGYTLEKEIKVPTEWSKLFKYVEK